MADHDDDREMAELAALADGSLTGERRERAQKRVAASPAARAALDEQRRVLTAVRAVAPAAPASLRKRIEADRRRLAPARRRRRLVLGAGFASAVAAVLLALVFALPSGTGGPTVVQAAGLATFPVTDPVTPGPAPATLLDVQAEGLPFPDWTTKFGWRAVGRRGDDLEQRRATTVFYEKNGSRIAYTIVSGAALDVPDGAAAAQREGTQLRSVDANGRIIVTWQRGGRTCVLSGASVALGELLNLAGWRGKGTVPF